MAPPPNLRHPMAVYDPNNNYELPIELKPLPFQPGYQGTPAVVSAMKIIGFRKYADGRLYGRIRIASLVDGPVTYKIFSTANSMFEYLPSQFGIIQANEDFTITVTTKYPNKVAWGDVRHQLFLIQSNPIEVVENPGYYDPASEEELVQRALKTFWPEDKTIRTDSEKYIVIPMAGEASIVYEPSMHEMEVQEYLDSFLIRSYPYWPFCEQPDILDSPAFRMDYQQQYQYLEGRVLYESWFSAFKNRISLVYCDEQRLDTLKMAYRNVCLKIFICLGWLASFVCSAYWFWERKTKWDEFLAARERNNAKWFYFF